MNKKKTIKFVALIASILPYVYFLYLGIQNLMEHRRTSSLPNYFNWDDIIIPVGDFWTEALTAPNILNILLILFAIGYPMYYFMTLKDSYFVRTWSYILYMISFIVYLPLVSASIIGFNFFMTQITGFEAISMIFLIGCAIPVYPFMILFHIIYFLKHRMHFSKIQKIILKTVSGLLLLCIVLPCFLH